MTYNEETYLLDKVDQLTEECHENNAMLKQIVSYIEYVCSQRKNDESRAFEQNVVANIVSEMVDNIKGKYK